MRPAQIKHRKVFPAGLEFDEATESFSHWAYSDQSGIPQASRGSFEDKNLSLIVCVESGYELPSVSGQFMPHPVEFSESPHSGLRVQFFHGARLMTLHQFIYAGSSRCVF